MKFLIDECLSPDLAMLARAQGSPESTHVSWLGMAGEPDWKIARRAADDGYVLVTHNTVDFRALYNRESLHAGLIGFNTPPRLMSLGLQKQLFILALKEWADDEPYNTALEITVHGDGHIRIDAYPLPDRGAGPETS